MQCDAYPALTMAPLQFSKSPGPPTWLMPTTRWIISPAQGPSGQPTAEALPTLDEALRNLRDHGIPVHLLVGNGLSIQARLPFITSVINQYASTYPLGQRAIELIRNIPSLSPEDSLAYLQNFPVANPRTGESETEYSLLRDALMRAIADAHPDGIDAIYMRMRQSVANFFNRFDTVFTTNYDLLPYWTIRHDLLQDTFSDGFAEVKLFDDLDVQYSEFTSAPKASTRTLWYLHGSLNIYNEEERSLQINWDSTQESLHDIFLQRYSRGQSPVIVLEGTSKRKRMAIDIDPYLSVALANLGQIEGALVTFGFGFSWQDSHIIDAILQNQNLEALYVGLHGDYFSPENLALWYRIERRRLLAYEEGNDTDMQILPYRSNGAFG